jgi:hypothetical protein
MLKVKNDDSLLRDPHSNAIVKTDVQEMIKFKKERQNMEIVNSLKQDVSLLQSEMTDIKSLLHTIINKL